ALSQSLRIHVSSISIDRRRLGVLRLSSMLDHSFRFATFAHVFETQDHLKRLPGSFVCSMTLRTISCGTRVHTQCKPLVREDRVDSDSRDLAVAGELSGTTALVGDLEAVAARALTTALDL